jgi:hypothetical protein
VFLKQFFNVIIKKKNNKRNLLRKCSFCQRCT